MQHCQRGVSNRSPLEYDSNDGDKSIPYFNCRLLDRVEERSILFKISQSVTFEMASPKMAQVRKIGLFFAVCGFLCGLISFQKYQIKMETAKTIAEMMNLEVVKVPIPIESIVAGFLCVMLLVAGGACMFRQE